MRVRIKICCIASAAEAKIVIDHGADAIGLVGKMPSGPGPIEDDAIAAIARMAHPPISTFLLTSEQSVTGIIGHAKRTNTNTLQIVDELLFGTYAEIKSALPYINIVQVIHVTGKESIEKAKQVQHFVDAILLDSGNPKATIKILGGTGNTHNWDISKQLVKEINLPVFLAGGLDATNVKRAIEIVQPFGVDVCSGVRTDGKLDPKKVNAFVKAVHSV